MATRLSREMIRYRISDRKQPCAVRPKAPNSPLRARSPRGVIPANKVALRTQSGRARREPLMDGTIDLDTRSSQDAARERAFSLPLDQFDPGHPELFRSDTHWPYFDRLRKEDPVHYCKDSMFGPYWSVTRYNDIMAIDTNHQVFSSAASLGGITIRDVPVGFPPREFHRDGPAAPLRTAQDRGADVHADQSRRACGQYPQARGGLPRQCAGQRSVRLRRHDLDRTDHPDAGGAVRLPLGGSPQADALVRRRNDAAGTGRRRRHRGGAPGRVA